MYSLFSTKISSKTLPTSQATRPRTSARRIREVIDRGGALIITAGGLATILSIIGIFAYLLLEVAPLWYPASASKLASIQMEPLTAPDRDSGLVGVGIDEYMEVAYVLQGDRISLFRIPSGEPISLNSASPFETRHISAMGRSSGKVQTWGLGTRKGEVLPLTVNFTVSFDNDIRTIHPDVTTKTPFTIATTAEPIIRLAYQKTEEGQVAAALTQSGRLHLVTTRQSGGLFAMDDEQEVIRAEILDERVPTITTLLLDSMGESLLAGTHDGHLLYWDVRDMEAPRLMGSAVVGSGITALSYLIGDRSIVVGTSTGQVEVWMPFTDPDKGGDPTLLKIREFAPHGAAVTAISPSLRNKGFLTADATGHFAVHYSTSSQTLLEIPSPYSAIHGLMFAPKGNGALLVHDNGELSAYHLENEHPEVTLASLFTPVLYEGYNEPLHIWQSTGGSDAFEPKFGLWPLMFGTLKGTFYAMLLATPLAVLGAIYTAMFMNPNLRAIIKPTVEIMAALPTVVLGFLAGLWFAPLLEDIFPSVSAMFVAVPLAVMVGALSWHFFQSRTGEKSGHILELLTLLLLVGGAIWLCLFLNTEIESWLYDSDYKAWLSSTFGVSYDQRNALVIAFAMGMAVIPTIFSISEDSISNVPRHLIAGSLALGATPWQTLVKLVIVSASPGIFSALMIGLGRAVGETMIVLMATGNTPVMDWNLFNGFRTLSANIAVEIPEAPHGGTLYRLLFLCGLILFIFTSIANSIAEIIRQRLRTRYSQF